eukprot:272570_1
MTEQDVYKAIELGKSDVTQTILKLIGINETLETIKTTNAATVMRPAIKQQIERGKKWNYLEATHMQYQQKNRNKTKEFEVLADPEYLLLKSEASINSIANDQCIPQLTPIENTDSYDAMNETQSNAAWDEFVSELTNTYNTECPIQLSMQTFVSETRISTITEIILSFLSFDSNDNDIDNDIDIC